MEHVLRDKNENISSGQLVLPSKSDMEISSAENLKENNNPRSLIEIVSDTTNKFQLDASTPKNSKKSSSFKDASFNMNFQNNDSISYQENTQFNEPSGLSFISNQLNNLKIKTDETASDDEEPFLSFNDMSNRINDNTLILEKNEPAVQRTENNENANLQPSLDKQEEKIQNLENKEDTAASSFSAHNNTFEGIKSISTNENIMESFQPSLDIQEKIQNVENEEALVAGESFTVPNNIFDGIKNNNENFMESFQPSLDMEFKMPVSVSKKSCENIENQIVENEEATSPASPSAIESTFEGIKNITKIENSLESLQSTLDIQEENIQSQNVENEEALVTGESISAQNSTFECIKSISNNENFKESLQPSLDLHENIQNVENEEVTNAALLSAHDTTFEGIKSISNNENFKESLQPSLDKEFKMPVSQNSSENIENEEVTIAASFSAHNSTFDGIKSNNENLIEPHNNTFDCIKSISNNENFMESFQPSLDVQFKMPTMPLSRKSSERIQNQNFENEVFTSAASYNFGDSDFDFLQNFGSNSSDQNFGRDSVLLKFDPLLAKPVPQTTSNFEKLAEEDELVTEETVQEHPEKPILQAASNLEKLVEEDELVSETIHEDSLTEYQQQETRSIENSFSSVADEFPQLIPSDIKDMSVEIMKDISSDNEKQINNLDCEEIKLSSIDHHENQNNKLMELENKMRMEAEQREEVLLKRISEKDKQISKMSNVVKEYEKAIAELIAEKEQLVQSYEKRCADLKNDSEMNAQHLASLESTFSDLHSKYERTKQLASDLKEREESTLQDRKALMDNLKMQEARYEKMKTHAMAQLEIANNKLAEMLRNHQAEVTKLKAQLKKEEISRASINDQLIHKTKENAELVKICDELIGNHGNSHAV